MLRQQGLRPDFRTDINGLRAWAVGAVILYHFGVPGFGGGFVGVDVFFVISGFLMTGIVIQSLETGRFSLIGFYLARARRIIPALAVLCAVLLALGWVFLLPPDYKLLGTHAVYSLSFLSNIEFYREAGYFDLASHEKWLLHTWSLSVEWQFYMALPIALWATWKVKAGRAAQAAIIALAFALSFGAALWVTARDPSAAFFLLPARAWEMLAGGLIFLVQRSAMAPRLRQLLEYGGLLLIAVCVAVFDKHTPWPGWRAMLPVAAAMMLILANGRSALTSHHAMQWLGERSYSLYLWHWPVYVALVYVELHHAPAAICAALLLTLVLGHLSYLVVERHGKRLLELGQWRALGAVGVALALVALPGVLIWSQNGVGGRFGPAIEIAAAEAANSNPRNRLCHTVKGVTSASCVHGGKEKSVMLVGDSHADAIVSALAEAGASGNEGVVQWTYSGCQFVPGMKFTPARRASLHHDYHCAEFNDWVSAQIAHAPPQMPVVMVGRYARSALGENEGQAADGVPSVYFSTIYPRATPAFLKEFSDKLVSTTCAIARQRPVYLMRPIPEMGVNVPKAMSRRLSFGASGDISIPLADYQQRNAWIIAAQDEARNRCGAHILDPLPYLCHDGRCHGSKGGRALYTDSDHLSEYGTKLLTPMFAEVFQSAISPAPALARTAQW
jgi:peptidoglycan/LPS O-acetylase OafA/YrhL